MINPKHFSDMFLRFLLLTFLLGRCKNRVAFGQQNGLPSLQMGAAALLSFQHGEIPPCAHLLANWATMAAQSFRA